MRASNRYQQFERLRMSIQLAVFQHTQKKRNITLDSENGVQNIDSETRFIT